MCVFYTVWVWLQFCAGPHGHWLFIFGRYSLVFISSFKTGSFSFLAVLRSLKVQGQARPWDMVSASGGVSPGWQREVVWRRGSALCAPLLPCCVSETKPERSFEGERCHPCPGGSSPRGLERRASGACGVLVLPVLRAAPGGAGEGGSVPCLGCRRADRGWRMSRRTAALFSRCPL